MSTIKSILTADERHASYSIMSNRLFLWPETVKGIKMLPEEYERLKRAGLATWWPRGCFTGLWSPAGEDLLKEWCGNVDEDDNEDDLIGRTGRYEKYAGKAEDQASSAQERILSGHAHTKRQVKMAEGTLSNGTEKAIYWNQRIAGAIRHAAYKDKPDVIVRRIQGIEKDLRKESEYIKTAQAYLVLWRAENPITMERALAITARASSPYSYRGEDTESAYTRLRNDTMTAEQAQTLTVAHLQKFISHCQRWIDHYGMRIQYETEYLEAVGGDPRKATVDVRIGDIVSYQDEECEVVNVGKKNLRIVIPSHRSWNPGGRLVGREDIGAIVRRGSGDKKANVRRSAAPDDGMKKGVVVEWSDPYSFHKGKFKSAIVSLGTRNIKVVKPIDDPEWQKLHGNSQPGTVEIERRRAKVVTDAD